jgi:hypothetical protein
MLGVMNAIEMQIEDGQYRHEAVVHLGDALLETAKFYGLSPAVQTQLEDAFSAFLTYCKKRQGRP